MSKRRPPCVLQFIYMSDSNVKIVDLHSPVYTQRRQKRRIKESLIDFSGLQPNFQAFYSQLMLVEYKAPRPLTTAAYVQTQQTSEKKQNEVSALNEEFFQEFIETDCFNDFVDTEDFPVPL